MSTKTMRLPPRRISTSNNKRKEAEGGADALSPPKRHKPDSPRPGSNEDSDPPSSNQLLAGYLAHEFLTKGTLFGQPWDPAGAEPDESTASKPTQEAGAEPRVGKLHRYLEVADLINGGGAHLPGIVNPTQLAGFLRL